MVTSILFEYHDKFEMNKIGFSLVKSGLSDVKCCLDVCQELGFALQPDDRFCIFTLSCSKVYRKTSHYS